MSKVKVAENVVNYRSLLNTQFPEVIEKLNGSYYVSDGDVMGFRKGRRGERVLFRKRPTPQYVHINSEGKVANIIGPYPGSIEAHALDGFIYSGARFQLGEDLYRPIVWFWKKTRPSEEIDSDAFSGEINDHGGIDLLQHAFSTDFDSRYVKNKTVGPHYILCADGARFVMDNEESTIIRL